MFELNDVVKIKKLNEIGIICDMYRYTDYLTVRTARCDYYVYPCSIELVDSESAMLYKLENK